MEQKLQAVFLAGPVGNGHHPCYTVKVATLVPRTVSRVRWFMERFEADGVAVTVEGE